MNCIALEEIVSIFRFAICEKSLCWFDKYVKTKTTYELIWLDKFDSDSISIASNLVLIDWERVDWKCKTKNQIQILSIKNQMLISNRMKELRKLDPFDSDGNQ